MHLKSYESALSDLNNCLLINPKNAEAYLNRGAVKLRLEDKEGACADFKQSAALGNTAATENVIKYCDN